MSSAGGAALGVNVKDRHVVAAAIAGEATVLVSNDRRLRHQLAATSAIGIEPLASPRR